MLAQSWLGWSFCSHQTSGTTTARCRMHARTLDWEFDDKESARRRARCALAASQVFLWQRCKGPGRKLVAIFRTRTVRPYSIRGQRWSGWPGCSRETPGTTIAYLSMHVRAVRMVVCIPRSSSASYAFSITSLAMITVGRRCAQEHGHILSTPSDLVHCCRRLRPRRRSEIFGTAMLQSRPYAKALRLRLRTFWKDSGRQVLLGQ